VKADFEKSGDDFIGSERERESEERERERE
jgi:hypothetical protein